MSLFNLAFAIVVSHAWGKLVVPFFQIIHQSWRIFFLHCQHQVHTHVYVCYSIEYAMRICSVK